MLMLVKRYSNTACSLTIFCPADGSIIKIKAIIKATEEVRWGPLLCACVFTTAGTEGDVVPQIPEMTTSHMKDLYGSLDR